MPLDWLVLHREKRFIVIGLQMSLFRNVDRLQQKLNGIPMNMVLNLSAEDRRLCRLVLLLQARCHRLQREY